MTMDQQEQIVRINRLIEESQKFSAEMRLRAQKDDRQLWIYPISGMIAGAALFGAGAAFMKLLGA